MGPPAGIYQTSVCRALGVKEEAGRGGLLSVLEGCSTRITPLSCVEGKNRGKGIAIRSTTQLSATSVQAVGRDWGGGGHSGNLELMNMDLSS